jgi:hypothetical protein
LEQGNKQEIIDAVTAGQLPASRYRKSHEEYKMRLDKFPITREDVTSTPMNNEQHPIIEEFNVSQDLDPSIRDKVLIIKRLHGISQQVLSDNSSN